MDWTIPKFPLDTLSDEGLDWLTDHGSWLTRAVSRHVADWIDALTDLKLATSFGGGHLAMQLMHIALTDSGYRRHMQSVRSRLADARRNTLRKLHTLGITPWLQPEAGLFLWCQLPACRLPACAGTALSAPAHRSGGQRSLHRPGTGGHRHRRPQPLRSAA